MLSLVVLGVFVSYLFYKFIVYPAFLSPLAAIPNAHFTSSFSNAWLIWQKYRGQSNKAIHHAHRLGPIVRLGLTEISVNSVEGVNLVYSFEKDPFYIPFENYGEPNMFSMVQKQAHAKRRRMFANIYSKSSLLSSAVIQELCQAIFIERFLPVIESANGAPLNMLDYGTALFSDFTTAFVFGLQSGSNFVQDRKSREHWQAAKKAMIKAQAPLWIPSISSFLVMLGISKETPQQSSGYDEIKDLYLKMLQKAEALSAAENNNSKWTEPVVYNQMLNQLRFSSEKTYPLPESHLRFTIASELMDHLVAGTETSGWTLAYLMQELSKRSNLQDSLRKELTSLSPPILYSAGNLNLPSTRSVDALRLLDAIVLETLRLHAPVAGSQPRVTPSQSPTSVLGYLIPPGICISAQAYSLHRNAEIFPDPQSWNPERWLTSKGERAEMIRWFWAFGSGANMCLGNNLALLELKFAVAAIYTNYTTKIIDDEDMEQTDGYVSGPKGEKLMLQFERVG